MMCCIAVLYFLRVEIFSVQNVEFVCSIFLVLSSYPWNFRVVFSACGIFMFYFLGCIFVLYFCVVFLCYIFRVVFIFFDNI